MKKRPVYVIGHKNPDTDSIVSAIAYANLKNKLGVEAVAGRLGGVSSEAEYLLKRFGFDDPVNLFTGKCILKDIDIDEAKLIPDSLTIKEALDLVVQGKNRSIIVASDDNRLLGIVANDDFNSVWSANDEYLNSMMSTITFEDIVKTLAAEVIYKDEKYSPSGYVDFFPSYTTTVHQNAFVVTNNSPEIQRRCVDSKVAILVICGESWIDDVTLHKAKENHVSVISTQLAPLSVSRLIFQAVKVKHIMTPKEIVVSFGTRDTVDEVGQKMTKSRYHSYPVLNHYGQVVGAVGRFHLLNYSKKQLILVDHNEMSQSINDIESAEVIEIVDHHRLGGLETNNPIQITTMIVGATATIVTLKYLENKVEIDKDMAGLLLGGIIADTMNFKSPTTTQIDIDTAYKLEKISGVSIAELSEGLINSSESILNKRNIEIVYTDFKEFEFHNLKVGLAQTQVKNAEEFLQVKDKVSEYLDEVCTIQKYDFVTVMFTIPNGSGSYLLTCGRRKDVVDKAFKDIMVENNFAPEIVSRKKQVLPKIIEVVEVK